MDEVIFRSSQKIENLQLRLNVAASHTKDVFQEYTEQSKGAFLRMWNSPYSMQVRYNTKELWHYLASISYGLKHQLLYFPQRIYGKLSRIFWRKWTTRDIYFLGAGFILGTICGYAVFVSLRKIPSSIRYMRAIQCTNYLGIESATIIENAIAPSDCQENQVLINVTAGSVHVMDMKICHGYGRKVRNILQRLHKKANTALPVTLGRDCTGIVTDIGQNVKRFEVGDHVWLAVPFWADGTLAQTILVDEFLISRKPKNIGFEQACSLPYSGAVALHALKEAAIIPENAHNKRVLVIGGCTPVGCILIQLLKYWKCTNITATCYKRAGPVAKALGAYDIIICPDPDCTEELTTTPSTETRKELNAFVKELELRDKYDVVIVTRDTGISTKTFLTCCKSNEGILLSTLPGECSIDSYGPIEYFIFKIYLRFKHIFEVLFGVSLNDYSEAHMCSGILDELSDLVENGSLQTVVDKVLQPENIEIALHHIQSHESIGSTVITFR